MLTQIRKSPVYPVTFVFEMLTRLERDNLARYVGSLRGRNYTWIYIVATLLVNLGGDGRSFDPYTTSTPFPFTHDMNRS